MVRRLLTVLVLLACTVSASAQVKKPANAIKLTSGLFVGKTWTYAHRNFGRFGNLVLRFDQDQVRIHNNVSSAVGLYAYRDELVCFTFDRKGWPAFCAFVVEDDGRNRIIYANGSHQAVLRIE